MNWNDINLVLIKQNGKHLNHGVGKDIESKDVIGIMLIY